MARLLPPDASAVLSRPPRLERLRHATATPFRMGEPFVAGTRFPYPVSGALYSAEGALVELSRRVSGIGGDHVRLADPDALDPGAAAVRIPGRGCYIGHLFEHYGHLVTETLSALWPVVGGKTFDYFACHPFGEVTGPSGAGAWALRRLGVEPSLLHVIRARTWFEDLTVPERTWQPNLSVLAAYRDVAGALARPYWQERPSRRAYLSRSRVPNRAIENEQEIERIFEERGYEVIHPETMTLEEQLACFGSCALIAGFAGSALHSIVFCPPGTEVVSLGDRRTRGTLLPNQRLCNAISGCLMALVPFAEGEGGFDLTALGEEVPAAEALLAEARRGLSRP